MLKAFSQTSKMKVYSGVIVESIPLPDVVLKYNGGPSTHVNIQIPNFLFALLSTPNSFQIWALIFFS